MWTTYDSFFFFFSDTVGNLIAFSDGTFSGASADKEFAVPNTLPTLPVSKIDLHGNSMAEYCSLLRNDIERKLT